MKKVLINIKSALDKFISEQFELLIQDAHEGAITGLMIEYLAEAFDDYEFSIDTQYNKKILDNQLIKKEAEFLIDSLPLKKWPKTWDKDQEFVKREILPDIIFHDRSSSNHNFLIIEVKKSTNKSISEREWDLLKLSAMTAGGLNYEYGLFVDFKTGKDFQDSSPYDIMIYEKGKVTFKNS